MAAADQSEPSPAQLADSLRSPTGRLIPDGRERSRPGSRRRPRSATCISANDTSSSCYTRPAPRIERPRRCARGSKPTRPPDNRERAAAGATPQRSRPRRRPLRRRSHHWCQAARPAAHRSHKRPPSRPVVPHNRRQLPVRATLRPSSRSVSIASHFPNRSWHLGWRQSDSAATLSQGAWLVTVYYQRHGLPVVRRRRRPSAPPAARTRHRSERDEAAHTHSQLPHRHRDLAPSQGYSCVLSSTGVPASQLQALGAWTATRT